MKLISIQGLLLAMVLTTQAIAQQSKVKNVIVMIPDGTSTDVLTLTRWFNNNKPLAVDSLVCGMVKTYNIDQRFPDSAPTSTAYATGVKSSKKSIGVDSAGVPHLSVFEMARMQNKSTGIVVTCEFPHATPADFVCHNESRRDYETLSKQFVYNSPDVLFSGGNSLVEKYQLQAHLELKHIQLVTNRNDFDKISTNSLLNAPVWGLFSNYLGDGTAKSFECDRTESEPSLSETTQKAIDILKNNPNGFFLMVEGSHIDWACHSNDPYAAVTEFAEFDKAVAVALKFAQSNSETVVVVIPDHGNGGITLGNAQSNMLSVVKNPNKYDYVHIPSLIIEPLKQVKCSSSKLATNIVKDIQYASVDSIKALYNLDLNAQDIESIQQVRTQAYAEDSLSFWLGRRYSDSHFIGWTTNGHTAEDVFLGVYAPNGIKKIGGIVENNQVGDYLAELVDPNYVAVRQMYYQAASDVFTSQEIVSTSKDKLIVKRGKTMLEFEANTNRMTIVNGKQRKTIELSTLIVNKAVENGQWIYFLPKTLAY